MKPCWQQADGVWVCRRAARGLGPACCMWQSSLLRCPGCWGKHAQKRRKYRSPQSGECWKSCESRRSSGRECLVSSFRKYLITRGVRNVLFSRLHALTWEECFSPLYSVGKPGEGQSLGMYATCSCGQRRTAVSSVCTGHACCAFMLSLLWQMVLLL